ncbi:MFS transporter [Actinomadura soli]|uniref:MFS transporter n=1 Tax=Actinomadura soli TaxID=2508997 RepID=A0A5C4JCT2_9ACTN|nr:MFS transporter [Actinomadura soli]TMR01843.1 MFS transporter [Actinomadura soli]
MRGHDFTLLWSASAASQLGHMCALTANPLLALLLTGSPVVAGWVSAAGTVPALLMHLFAGWLVDRLDRRRLMLAGQVGRLAAGVLPLGAIAFRDWAAALLILFAFFEGLFLVLYNTAEVTAVRHVVTAKKLPTALATNEARGHLAQLLGRPLGGFLLGCGKYLPHLVGVLVSVWAIFALSLMRQKNFRPRDVHDPSMAGPAGPAAVSFRTVLRIVLRSPFLRTVLIIGAVGNFCFQALVLSLLVLAREHDMSGGHIGLLLATSGICGLIGSIAAPKIEKWLGDERTIGVCVAAWSALTLVVALVAEPVTGLVAWGGLSLTGGLLNVALINHQTGRVPEHMLGRVMGLSRFLTGGTVPLGALTAGYLVAALGPRSTTWLACAGVLLLACVVPVLMRPRLLRSRLTIRRRAPRPARLRRVLPDGHPEPQEAARHHWLNVCHVTLTGW